jgi:glycosyltransferase involved in cell wall biosynthesis
MTTRFVGAPLAAVIIPCFDDGEALGDAVDSVRNEDLDIELVVVDDGSTDAATLAILTELERENVHVIRQPNQGPSAATMAGLNATSAEYVMRLDADDLLEPGGLLSLAAALDRAPGAAVAWGDLQTFGLTSFRVPTAPSLDPWLLTYTNGIPGAGCLMRRTAVLEVGGWQLWRGWEDWDLWLAFVEHGWRGVYVPRIVFRYRRDKAGRQMASEGHAEEHYVELRRRHESLFERRDENRRASDAPRVVKLLVTVIEAFPGLSRLARIQLCELVTHLFWNGGLKATATMLRQSIAWRLAAARQPAAG